MRIGIDVSSALSQERTGVEEYTYQLAKYISLNLRARKNELVFYAPRRREYMWHERKLPALIAQSKLDVFFSPSNPIPLRMPSGVKTVATIHGLEWKRAPKSYSVWQRSYLSLRTRQTIGRADALIVPSYRSQEGLFRFFEKQASRIPVEVVYHGKPEITYKSRKRQVTSYKNLIFIGRKDKRKNIARMIEAFHIIRRAHETPIRFTILGGRGNDRYANNIHSERFGDSVLDISPYVAVYEKQRILQESDVLLLPSLDEGFGMPIVEAHSYGVPVVTSTFLLEVGGKGATYCNPYSVTSIADATLQLLGNDQYYRQSVRSARENSKRFSWERSAEETLDFLIKIGKA